MGYRPSVPRVGSAARRSRVVARAATLTVDETRHLYGAWRRLEFGTFRSRAGWALLHRGEVSEGPLTRSRKAADSVISTPARDEVHVAVEAALALAAAGRAAIPGDPGWLRSRLRRFGLIASWGAVVLLGGLLAMSSWNGYSAVAQALGAMILVSEILTTWVVLVPTRGPTVIAAVEGAVYADLWPTALPASVSSLLAQPWRDAVASPTLAPAPSRLDRLSGWLAGIAVLMMVAGIGVGLLPGERIGLPVPAAFLLFGGVALCFIVLGVVGIAGVGDLVRRRPAADRPRLDATWTTPDPVPGSPSQAVPSSLAPVVPRATPPTPAAAQPVGGGLAARVLLAGIVGGLAFGVGDAATGVPGWPILVVVVALSAVLGWVSPTWWVIAGYVVGGFVGTWLSVEVRTGQDLSLSTELLGSAFVALVCLGVARVAAFARRSARPGTVAPGMR